MALPMIEVPEVIYPLLKKMLSFLKSKECIVYMMSLMMRNEVAYIRDIQEFISFKNRIS